MKLKNVLLGLFILLIVPVVFGAIVYDLNSPVDLLQTTSSSVLFNWTINSTSSVDNPMPSYLFITNQSDESQFLLNQTVRYCLNNSVTGGNSTNNSCSVTVSGFNTGFYQWQPQILSPVSG